MDSADYEIGKAIIGKPVYDKNKIDTLVNIIQNAKKSLIIMTGEMNCHLFGQERIFDAFVDAKERGVETIVAAGPLLSTIEGPSETPLIKYVNNGLLHKVYFSQIRQRYHFRIADNDPDSMYIEVPHKPMEKDENRKRIDYENKEDKMFWLNEMKSQFKTSIDSEELVEIINYHELSVFPILTPDQFDRLNEYLENEEQSYYFSIESIVQILKRLEIEPMRINTN